MDVFFSDETESHGYIFMDVSFSNSHSDSDDLTPDPLGPMTPISKRIVEREPDSQ
jgi:hypothetical protein